MEKLKVGTLIEDNGKLGVITKVIEIFPYIAPILSKKKDINKADTILIASFFYNTYKSSV